MLYSTITINGRDYKARLTARALVDLEKKLGTSPINVFVKMGQNEGFLPNLEDMIMILHASLQAMEHGITLEKTYELYDQMIDEGKNIADLLNFIVEIFTASGLIPKVEEENEKN
jgi:hypothetical protein